MPSMASGVAPVRAIWALAHVFPMDGSLVLAAEKRTSDNFQLPKYLVSGSPSSRDFVASAFRRKKGGAGAGHFRLKAEATRHLSSEPISLHGSL